MSAAFCAVDQHGRPTAGTINFGPAKIENDESKMPKQIGVAIHEITHVLGFTSTKILDFRDPENNFTILPAAQIVQKQSVDSGTSTKQVTKVVTPTVVQVQFSLICSGL